MNDPNIQKQIDEINRKLDLILEEVIFQKRNREATEDLLTDLSIVGKDVFNTAVVELDKAGIELQSETVSGLFIRLLRNLDNINELLDTIESVNDFLKDAAPILRQAGLDAIHKLHELEKKGYFEFLSELSRVLDNIVQGFTAEDVRLLADNIVTILNTVKNLTQPDMLAAINNAVRIYKSIEIQDVPEISLWKALRELNSPEMRKALGFLITFLKNLTKEENNLVKSY